MPRTSAPKRPHKCPTVRGVAKKPAEPKRVQLTRCKRVAKTRSEGPTPALQKLNFILQINTTNTSPQRGMLLNRFEEPDSEITSLKAGVLQRYDPSVNEMFELTRAELAQPGYVGESLLLESVWQTRDGRIVDTTRHIFYNDIGFFTVAEVVAHIVEFERIDRPKSQWFGGIDCHHVFFEGLRPNSDGDAFRISWGS